MNTQSATRPSEPSDATAFDYIVLSDVHLGSDIVPYLRPWATDSWLREEAEIDQRLVSLLAYHRGRVAADRRIRLVVAGDFLELVGMSLPPRVMKTALTREEKLYGLGSAPDHVAAKVEVIAGRHPRVFRALAEFVSEGHEVVIIRGNHDIELYWQAAQRALLDAILDRVPAEQRNEARARISIRPWFYRVPSVLYVEHGHHFDTMCSYGDPLLPTCLSDSRRIRPVPFSVLLRNVARPTRGLSSSRYEDAGFGSYIALLAELGVVGSVRLAVRFARAVTCLMKEHLRHVVGQSARRRMRTEVRRLRHARRAGLSLEQVAALEALHAPPATTSFAVMLRTLYLDRVFAIALGVLCTVLLVALMCYGAPFDMNIALLAAVAATYTCVARDRTISPIERIRESADAIAKVVDAPWIVMGHTHHPTVVELANGARYVNVGHWGEDDLPEERAAESSPNMSTYLHLTFDGRAYRGELRQWDMRVGDRIAVLEAKRRRSAARPNEPMIAPAQT